MKTNGSSNSKSIVLKSIAILTGIVLFVLSAIGVTGAAAQSSIPGDALYPVKTGIEQARLSLAQDAGDRAQMKMAFAAQRLEEIDALVREARYREIRQAVVAFETDINSALMELETVSQADPGRSVAIAGEIAAALNRYARILSDLASVAPDAIKGEVSRALDTTQLAGGLNQSNTNDDGGSGGNDANTNDENGNDADTNDDNGNNANTNDDNGSDTNGNDDNGNDDSANTNDDAGSNDDSANTNDDNGNDANTNDDNGSDANTNDDAGSNDDSANTNDDNGNDDSANTNDDNGGDDNANLNGDAGSNDDSGGSGGSDDSGNSNDDSGGSGGSDDSGSGNDDSGGSGGSGGNDDSGSGKDDKSGKGSD